jgi:hypothetical protein
MRHPARWILTVLLAAAAVLGVASAAPALASLSSVASALKQSPVYNDPAAEAALSPGEVSDLLAQMSKTTTPIYIAVLPASFVAENGGTPRAALTNLATAVGRDGTYAMVAGRSLWTLSNTLPGVSGVASQALAENKGGTSYDVLSSFVAGVSDLAAGGTSGGSGSGGSSEGGFPWGWAILGGGALGIAGFSAYSIRRSRQRTAVQMQSVKAVVGEDVTSFGEQVAAFDIQDPRLDDAGRTDLKHAIDSYQAASDSLDRMKAPADAAAVTSHLEDGRYAMACVSARMEGKPNPERRAPCFFDPRHGPSVRDAAWTPPGGERRPVPVCSACNLTLSQGSMPQSREVPVGGESRPYWQAGPAYGPYAGGYFNSFGSVLPSILVGTMLGNALFPPTVAIDSSGMGGGAGDGGDFGGGGFDGGGFGGGGFGGGDFGGGDFGGGDF